MTKWTRLEVPHPAFRRMRYDRAEHRRRDWPYIEVNGVPYRVRRVVDDNVAWVTEVTNPLEKFAVVMMPSDTPFLAAVKRRNVETTKHAWGSYGDTERKMAGREQRSVPHDL